MNIIPNNIIITPADNDAATNEITLSADFCFLIPITARTIPIKATAIIYIPLTLMFQDTKVNQTYVNKI